MPRTDVIACGTWKIAKNTYEIYVDCKLVSTFPHLFLQRKKFVYKSGI